MKKGFTLLELLIVIAILAILAAAAVVVLNPAELLRRARDSERITDLANLRNSLNLYLTTVSSPALDNAGNPGSCEDGSSDDIWSHTTFATQTSQGLAAAGGAVTLTTSSVRTTGGSGWIPVNLDNTAGGSPLSALPIDSNPSTSRYYYYVCNYASTTYEIGANMESSEYANSGGSDVENTDGGNGANWYELGNDPGLNILP